MPASTPISRLSNNLDTGLRRRDGYPFVSGAHLEGLQSNYLEHASITLMITQIPGPIRMGYHQIIWTADLIGPDELLGWLDQTWKVIDHYI